MPPDFTRFSLSNENLWANLKKNVKNQIPKDYDELKKGDPEALNLVSKEAEKYPKQILIAGGISYYGLSDLIIVEGTMTDFAYGQTLLHYKKNFEEFKQKSKI